MIFYTVEESGRKLLSFRQNPPIRPTNRQTDEKALAVSYLPNLCTGTGTKIVRYSSEFCRCGGQLRQRVWR